ncbi:MAG TPA: murein L,D-transpeptidase catalytic domain family protein [Puia sp.]|nr:murein L,D-transpeptidase catalytic domain family protein [Puia sp.]
MKTLSKLVSTSSVSLLVITSPVLISNNHKKIEVSTSTAVIAATFHIPVLTNNNFKNFKYSSPELNASVTEKVTAEDKAPDFNASAAVKKAFEVKMVIKQALTLYDSMKLDQSGLNQKAFEYAWRGYHNLLKQGKLKKSYVLTVCDFTQSSSSKRLYVIDVAHKKLLFNTYVSHGMNSGVEYATSFSNRANSFKSSLGFFITSKTYFGRNGLSLKVKGLEKGYNDLAAKRHIVLHGSDYITPEYLKDNGEMGRSLGCAAMPNVMSPKIIKTIKNGSCLFIYHPTVNYLTHSNVING